MALRLGGRKQRRENGGRARCGGCRHFHVHVHLPRCVCSTFSFLRWWMPRFSLLSCVLTPLVLFFALLALAVSFVWFTLLYFVASLFNKDSDHESFKNDSFPRASDAHKLRREDSGQEGKAEAKAKAVKHVAELLTDDSATADVCVQRLEIKEVHVDGSSEVSQNISRMASSDACLNCEVRANDDKLVEDVIIFETTREEIHANADLEGFSRSHQVQDVPIGWFVEELDTTEVSTPGDSIPSVYSIDSAQIHDFPDMNEVVGMSLDFLVGNKQNMVVPSNTSFHHRNVRDNKEEYGQEFVDDRKELLACTSYGICDFIDKHETREQVLDGYANDEKIRLLTSSDGSAHGGIRDEHKKVSTEEKDAKSVLELLLDSVTTLEDFDEQQEIQKVPEVLIIDANTKQSLGASDKAHNFTNDNEKSVLSLYSVCEDTASSDAWFDHSIVYEDDKDKELIENSIVEESDPASVVCDFVENHQTTTEALNGFANDHNTGEVASLERSEDKADKISDNCTSKGAPRRLPVVRRSPEPWWNLCGVVHVFAGCKD